MVPKKVTTISLVILSIGALLAAATSVSFSQANAPDKPADAADVFLPLVVYHWRPSVYALSNHSQLQTSTGSLYVFGEVQNDLSHQVGFVSVPVTLLDSSGQAIETHKGFARLNYLPPGERTCFVMFVLSPPAGWVSYELGEPTYLMGGEPPPNLTIFDDQGSYDPTFGDYKVEGKVRNDHGSRVEFVKVIATLYDDTGTVVTCGSRDPDNRDLDPGESSDFLYTATLRDYADVASYRLQAGGKAQ